MYPSACHIPLHPIPAYGTLPRSLGLVGQKPYLVFVRVEGMIMIPGTGGRRWLSYALKSVIGLVVCLLPTSTV